MPFKDFCAAAPASWTYMHTVHAALHNSFARLILGCSTQNPQFWPIFNSSYCRLVGQVLFSTTLGFWTSLESCNIFKDATSCWQEQHKMESFSSSAMVDLLRAVWNALQRFLCCCSCVMDLHAHGSCSITQFLCTTDTWVLNPKSTILANLQFKLL